MTPETAYRFSNIFQPDVEYHMKTAVLSDIHANFQALSAVLEDLKDADVDEIISLGDNIGYGPQPEEVVTTLQENRIISIMGNHEYALADPAYYARLNPDPRKSLDIQRQRMSVESFHYCTTLPPLLIRHHARFIHGCPPRSITSYLVQPSLLKMQRIFSGYPEQFCFYGHLHTFDRYIFQQNNCRHEDPQIGTCQCYDDCRYLLNPGSVGQPRDGIDRRAKYAIWNQDAATFELRAVSYDSGLTKKLLREYNFPAMNGVRL